MHLGLETYAPTLIYMGAIVAFFLSIFWNPRIGLYFLVPLLPMQTLRYRLHELPLGEKLVDVILLGVLIGLLIHEERPVFASSRVNKIVIVISILTYIALWEGSFFQNLPVPLSFLDPRFSDWKNFIEMMALLFIAGAALRTPKHMAIMVVLMCLSVLLVNRSFHQTMSGRDFSQFSYGLRDAGPLGYAGENGMGAFQAQCAVFLIGLSAFARKIWVRLGLLFVALTCVYSLVFTFSRGGYLGFLVGVLVLGIIKERKLLPILALLLLVWQGIVPNAVRERVQMTYSEGEGLDSSAQERVDLWEDAISVIKLNPVLGAGFDTYKYMGRVGDFRDTHNYYLKVFVETGLVGLLILLWLIAASCKLSWQLFRATDDPVLSALGCSLLATMCCSAVLNLFGDRWTYLQVNGFLWVLLGMAARGVLIAEQGREVTPTMETAAAGSEAAHVWPL